MGVEVEAGEPSLFYAAFTNSDHAMLLVDAERVVVDVNKPFELLVVQSRIELVGRPTSVFVAREKQVPDADWAKVLAGASYTGSTELARPDGSVVGVEFSLTPRHAVGTTLVLAVAMHLTRGLSSGHARSAREPLSAREREVVALLVEGLTERKVGEALHLSEHTIHNHVRNAREKWGASSRSQLVGMYVADLAHETPA
jgi:PAS domain S-box-containing protein